MACRICFPDIDFHVGDWGGVCVGNSAEDETGFAGWVMGHGGAVGEGEGVVGVEGTED